MGEKIGTSLTGGEIIALEGDLGSGKTTFIQGLAKGLGVSSVVISPTFILMRAYPAGEKNFYHLDLYRLEGELEGEIENLGLLDLWGRKENVVVIEWAEKITKLLPKDTKVINFEYLGENERKIIVQ